jgi:protein required for attachment to host cells
MSPLSSEDLFIVADGQHFVLLAKNPSTSGQHLKAFKKVDYDREKYASKGKGDSGKDFDRMGIARSPHSNVSASEKSDIRYLKEACKVIDIEFKRGGFTRTTLIGDSEVISLIKKGMSKSMVSKVMREIYKNYTKMPIDQLEILLEK